MAVNSIHSSFCLPLAPSSITITSPTPESKVPLETTIQGTACHIQDGQELWIFLKPDAGTSYYPQDNPAVISHDGKWSASARIGLENKIEGFEVLTILLDQDGSAAIERYLQQPGPQQGFHTPPRAASVMSQVHVMRE